MANKNEASDQPMKYLVSNIKFVRNNNELDFTNETVIKMQVPATSELHAMREIVDYKERYVTDSELYMLYVRTKLFYSNEVTFNYTEADESAECKLLELDIYADLIDYAYENVTTALVAIQLPEHFIVDTELNYTDKQETKHEDIFYALFCQLPFAVRVVAYD